MEKETIVYISGDGHSGSTLLDILLGSQEKAFSAGELIFLPKKGIENMEYCSCGQPVPDCEVWSRVIDEWEKERILKLDEYMRIQSKLTSNKNLISSYLSLRTPSGKVLDFLKDTENLYRNIFKITETNIIVDSSKTPNKLLILKNLGFEVHAVHLIRRFGDVLNSGKKTAKKNLEAGIEHDIKPRSTLYVLFIWLLKNFLTFFYAKDMVYKRIKYEEVVNNPVISISKITNSDSEFADKLKKRGPFYPRHLVAGNAIRMKEYIYIAEKPMNTSYHRLNKADKFLAKCIDIFY